MKDSSAKIGKAESLPLINTDYTDQPKVDRIPKANRRFFLGDYFSLAGLTSTASVIAFILYYRHGTILLNGDAVAHINIARHVLDSRTPGILELGTVWLPLPHLITIPFVMNDWMWRTGIGGSIPSVIAFVVGALGIFRLVRGTAGRSAAWIAALIYALNPNLLYMQATAMTETLYLACFIWALVWFCEFARQASTDPQRARKSLELSGIMIAAAMLVRYDGWFLALCAATALVVILWRFKLRDPAIRRGAVNFVLLIGLTAILWLAYNYGAYYGRAFEFATGRYSAHAIADRARTATFPTYPGENSARTATLYFLKLVRVNLGRGWLDPWLLTIAFVALLAIIYFSRRHLPLILLWIPVLFYVPNIVSANVQIYFPEWWPNSYYNARYGLQMLPAVAVFVALGYAFLSNLIPARLTAGLIILLVAASYISVWHKQPICLREAEANGRARFNFDARLASELEKLPRSSTLMMYCGSDSGALQDAGIPFRRVVQEGNHPEWDIALSQPYKAADYVIAIEGDDVFYALRLFPQHLGLVATVETPGHPTAFVYRSLR